MPRTDPRTGMTGVARAEQFVDNLDDSVGTIVLVEGASDEAAVTTLAERFADGRSESMAVVTAYGITNFGRLLGRIRAAAPDRRVVGLYDEPEEHVMRRALQSIGAHSPHDRGGIERLGFFACVADLEDEFIRALGVDRVERLVEAEGELAAFRIMQQQPAQRDRSVVQQLRRFMGTKSMRKVRYGHLLAAAIELDHCPDPLLRVMSAATT